MCRTKRASETQPGSFRQLDKNALCTYVVARTNLQVRLEIVVTPEVVLLEFGAKDGRRGACCALHDPVPFHNLRKTKRIENGRARTRRGETEPAESRIHSLV